MATSLKQPHPLDRVLILVFVSDQPATAKDSILTRIQGVNGNDAVSKKFVAFFHYSHPEGGQLRHQDLGRVRDRTS